VTPPALDRVVKKCLAKEPDDRWQSARDLHDELKWIAEGGSQAGVAAPVVTQRRRRERIAWALAAAGLLLAAVLAFVFARSYTNQPKPSVIRFLVSPPENVNWGPISPISISPDGRFLAFVGVSQDGRQQLWLRRLDNVAAQELPGTDGARYPIWSPDSQYLAFFDSAGLKKVSISGGYPQTLSEVARGYFGSWGTDGVIAFSGAGTNTLSRVSEAGGAPSPMTTLDQSRGEFVHTFPWFLPDGRHFLYGAVRAAGPRAERWVCAGSLDSKETNCLLKADSVAVYAPPGYLLYLRGGTLMAQPFDAKRLLVTGDAVPIASSAGSFSISANGILAYVPGTSGEAGLQLQWFDRSGKKLGMVGQPADYSSPALSPDGAKIAVGIQSAGSGGRSIWIFDLKRGTSSRLTFDSADEFNPVWSRDGSQILFSSALKGTRDIYEKAAGGLGESQMVFESATQQKNVDDWSPDGRYVVYDITAAPVSLWILPLFGDRNPFPFVQNIYSVRQARFSPNTRYVAFSSDETGNFEIYVQTFPARGGKWQVSTGGGRSPEWRRDGKELYFLSGTKLMAVDVNTAGPQFEMGTPKPLFEMQFGGGTAVNPNAIYRPTADGQRFLVVTSAGQQGVSPVTMVTNWAAELRP
jgi:eukaryotic-like serine/threonine-protein kinase